jgi:hypothetical protein
MIVPAMRNVMPNGKYLCVGTCTARTHTPHNDGHHAADDSLHARKELDDWTHLQTRSRVRKEHAECHQPDYVGTVHEYEFAVHRPCATVGCAHSAWHTNQTTRVSFTLISTTLDLFSNCVCTC